MKLVKLPDLNIDVIDLHGFQFAGRVNVGVGDMLVAEADVDDILVEMRDGVVYDEFALDGTYKFYGFFWTAINECALGGECKATFTCAKWEHLTPRMRTVEIASAADGWAQHMTNWGVEPAESQIECESSHDEGVEEFMNDFLDGIKRMRIDSEGTWHIGGGQSEPQSKPKKSGRTIRTRK